MLSSARLNSGTAAYNYLLSELNVMFWSSNLDFAILWSWSLNKVVFYCWNLDAAVLKCMVA